MKNLGNVVLIGMPGAGKSTLGVVLAKIMNKGFVDVDLVIQRAQGETLQETIDREGADGFIAVENDVLCGINTENSIISTGGSAIYSDEGMQHLSQIGTIVYLEISYESLLQRLGDLHERGVVMRNGANTGLRALYDERKPLYERYAELTVNVDNLNITAAARKVAAALFPEPPIQ